MFDGLKRLAARFIYKSVSYSIRNAYESGATGRSFTAGTRRPSARTRPIINNVELVGAGARCTDD